MYVDEEESKKERNTCVWRKWIEEDADEREQRAMAGLATREKEW